jgi:hypothetical protein
MAINLKTISGFRKTEEASRIARHIEFRAEGFEHAMDAPDARRTLATAPATT